MASKRTSQKSDPKILPTETKKSSIIPEEKEQDSQTQPPPVEEGPAKPEWPVEILFSPEEISELKGVGNESQDAGKLANLQLDPDTQEYVDYVKSVLAEQGIKATSAESVQTTTTLDPEEGPIPAEFDGELEDSEEADSTSDEAWSTEEDSEEGRASDSTDGFVQELQPTKPIMGMKSFRYFEERILANFLQDNEDERMNALKAKFRNIKKVKAPSVPNLGPPVEFLKFPPQSENVEGNMGGPKGKTEEAGQDGNAEELGEGEAKFTQKQWALKHAESFLKTAGCQSPVQSLSNLKVKPKDQAPKLKVFLTNGGLGEKRRDGVGNQEAAKEIDSALRIRADRAVMRAKIENTRPRYPLIRFILPRHKYLRKIESELIGPGSYELDYHEILRKKRLATTPSQFRSCTSRFPKEKWRAPGADFIADPHEKWDAACLRNKHPGRGIPFESTPCNFRYKDFYVGCGIAPNYYNVPSPLEQFLKKSKHNKGTYDIPAGADVFCPKVKMPDPESRLGPGAYDVRESIVKNLTDSYNRFKGVISKTERRKMFGFKAAFENPLWPADNGYPGPATYKPYESEEWIEPSWAPFGIQGEARNLELKIQSKIVAPDYYFYGDGVNIDKGWVPEIHGGGLRSNFLSTAPQTTPENKHNIFKERNQALNFRLDQEVVKIPKGSLEC